MKEGVLDGGRNSIPVRELPNGVYMLEVRHTSAFSTRGEGAGPRTICRIVKE